MGNEQACLKLRQQCMNSFFMCIYKPSGTYRLIFKCIFSFAGSIQVRSSLKSRAEKKRVQELRRNSNAMRVRTGIVHGRRPRTSCSRKHATVGARASSLACRRGVHASSLAEVDTLLTEHQLYWYLRRACSVAALSFESASRGRETYGRNFLINKSACLWKQVRVKIRKLSVCMCSSHTLVLSPQRSTCDWIEARMHRPSIFGL